MDVPPSAPAIAALTLELQSSLDQAVLVERLEIDIVGQHLLHKCPSMCSAIARRTLPGSLSGYTQIYNELQDLQCRRSLRS